MRTTSQERLGTWLGLLGVLSFSLTLPATKIAVGAFHPLIVVLGRALLAAAAASVPVALTRQRRPSPAEWRSLVVVALGVVLGFPLLTTWALGYLPAAHGGVVLGLLPLATAGVAAVRSGERPSAGFWLASAMGSAIVIGFGLREGGGALHWADFALLGAVVAAAIGYAEGGRLARTLGSWQVISWALLLSAPMLVVPFVWLVMKHGLSGPMDAWVSLGYLGLVSQFGGFIAWYRGLALGGVARTSQLQLLQPFLTVLASALLLNESLTWETIAAVTLVVASVGLGRRAKVHETPGVRT